MTPTAGRSHVTASVDGHPGQVAPGGHLDRFTGYLLRRAYVVLARVTTACMPEDTHVREAVLLSALDEGGPTTGRRITEVTHLNRTLVVKLVDAVESRGWAVRGRHPTDRRCYALSLTSEGRTALTRMDSALDTVDELLTQGLTAHERETLR